MKNDDTFRYKAAFILFAAAYFLVSVTAKITADRERPVNVEVVTVEPVQEQTTKQTEQDIVRELPNETSVFIDLTISCVTSPGAETPIKTSAPLRASASSPLSPLRLVHSASSSKAGSIPSVRPL